MAKVGYIMATSQDDKLEERPQMDERVRLCKDHRGK